MLEQDLQSHENEHRAADELRYGFVFRAEYVADLYTDSGEGEGDHTDEYYRCNDVHSQESKGHTHS